jgi:hypothetical protein
MALRTIPFRIVIATIGAWLFGWAMAGPLMGTDLTIRTVTRNSGTPAKMNPETAERVVYLQGDRRRTEENRVQRNPLWPGGPEVPFYGPRSALIESCNGDTREAFNLDLDGRTIARVQMSPKVSPEELAALWAQIPQTPQKPPSQPTVLRETTTVDTGERKQAFGYTARHVITTFKVVPLAGATNTSALETVTDGWYIDLEPRISCDPPRREPVEGTTTQWGAVLTGRSISPDGQVTRQTSMPKPNWERRTYIGKPETGFAVWSKVTVKGTRPTDSARSGEAEQVRVTETEVTQLSTTPLDPALFEMPTNFRSVSRLEQLRMPRPAAWAQWLAWGHYYWVRLTKSI